MADNGNDFFTVLGKVEVDQGALDVSLAKAGNNIQSWAGKQKSVFEQIAAAIGQEPFRKPLGPAGPGGPSGPDGKSKGQWWSDPNMAFGQKTKEAAGAVGGLNEAVSKAHGGLRQYQHLINVIAPGTGFMVVNTMQLVQAFGILGVAIGGALVVWHAYNDYQEKTIKYFKEMNQAVEESDVDKLTQEYTKLADEARDTSNAFLGLMDSIGLSGAENARLTIIAGKMRESYESVAKQIERNIAVTKILLATDAEAAAREKSRAQTGKELDAAQAKSNKIRRDQYEQDVLASKQAVYQDAIKQKLWDTSQGREQITRRLEEADRLNKANLRKIEKDEANEVQDNEEKKAGIAARRFQREQAIIGFEKQKQQADIATSRTLLENDKAVADAETRFRGEAVRGGEEYLTKKKALTDQETDLEENALKVTNDMKRERLNKLIAGGDAHTDEYREQLADLEKEEEAALKGIAEKRKQTESQSSRESIEQKRAEIAEKVAVDDRLFNHQVAMGKKTYADQISQAKDAAGDYRRSQGEREQAEVRGQQLQKREMESYFGLRRTLGIDTINEEIEAQVKLNQTYKQGSEEWYNGVKKVADLMKQARDQARGTFQTMAGLAADRIKKRTGREDVTVAELEKEVNQARKEDDKTLSRASAGGRVKASDLLSAVGRQEGFEKFGAQGGNLSTALDKAITQPFQQFEGSTQAFGTAVDTFQDAVSRMSAAAGAQAAAQLPGSTLGAADMSSRIGRIGELEAKRGAAPQTTLS